MVVNFRARGISRGPHKVVRTLILKKKNNNEIKEEYNEESIVMYRALLSTMTEKCLNQRLYFPQRMGEKSCPCKEKHLEDHLINLEY